MNYSEVVGFYYSRIPSPLFSIEFKGYFWKGNLESAPCQTNDYDHNLKHLCYDHDYDY